LNITGRNAKNNFDRLSEIAKNQSLDEIDNNLQWLRMDDKKQSAVILTTNGDMTKKSQWANQFQWFKDNLEAFTNVFKPIIKKM